MKKFQKFNSKKRKPPRFLQENDSCKKKYYFKSSKFEPRTRKL